MVRKQRLVPLSIAALLVLAGFMVDAAESRDDIPVFPDPGYAMTARQICTAPL